MPMVADRVSREILARREFLLASVERCDRRESPGGIQAKFVDFRHSYKLLIVKSAKAFVHKSFLYAVVRRKSVTAPKLCLRCRLVNKSIVLKTRTTVSRGDRSPTVPPIRHHVSIAPFSSL